MDFFLKNLGETLEAINTLIDGSVYVVDTKAIRRCNGVPASDRSKINFIWRGLDFLVRKTGLLEKMRNGTPQKYKILVQKRIKIKEELCRLSDS